MYASASLSLQIVSARPLRSAISSVQLVALTYAVWLVAMTVLGTRNNASPVLLELSLLAGLLPAILQTALLPADTRGSGPSLWFMWAFVTLFLVTYLPNSATFTDLVNVFNVLFVFIIGALVASCTDESLIRRTTAAYAVATSVFLLHINLFGTYVWGRLSEGAAANVWGFVALNVAAGALCLKSRLLAGACWAVVLLTLYNAQARGSMVAVVPYAFVTVYYLLAYQRRIDMSWKVIVIVVVLLATLAAAAAGREFIINNVMRLNDPYRGAQSGLTGRSQAWAEALNLWFEHPLLGVGYRKHDEYMYFTGLNAHNAQIAMLADTGVIGFLLYSSFLVASYFAALRGIADPWLRLFVTAVIASYALAGLFERRAINSGNAYSITFIFVCLLALRHARFTAVARHPGFVRVLPAEVASDGPAERSGEPASAADADPRTERAREMVEAYLDVDAIALAGLGRHRVAISTPQWREYRVRLRDLIIYGYALHFADLSAENLYVDRIVPHGPRRATVRSRMRRSDGQIVSVDWRIRTLTRGGGFKVTDVVIEGASAAGTLRADVSAVIATDGIEQVCTVLRHQISAMRDALA